MLYFVRNIIQPFKVQYYFQGQRIAGKCRAVPLQYGGYYQIRE